MDRRAVMATLLAARGDALIVAGLGSTCYDAGTADHPNTFYLWGGMGSAAMTGLGLALAQPKRRVVVITGDGEMLMGMGSLATVGLQRPKNLSIIVLDNESYGETGGQMSHTAAAADLVGVARACGIADSKALTTLGEVEAFAASMRDVSAGPRFANIKIDAANLERVLSNRDGMFVLTRLRGALGLPPI
jgi:thiamine pyrophosphate-dependent acetolactate synthase large subunit-like protein